MAISEQDQLRSLVLADFMRRKTRNPAYSLRGYARDLHLSPASLSQLLNAKRKLSKKNILKVAQQLPLSPEQSAAILGGARSNRDDDFLLVDEDVFQMMSEWHYFAILSLAELSKTSSNHDWIAKRLGIPPYEVAEAVARLSRMGLLDASGKKLKRLTPGIRTQNDVPSAALRKYHKQNLRLAEASIDQDAVQVRDVSSVTMAVDPAKLVQAKEMIKVFRRKLSKFLESGARKEVYTLAIQLFPNTRSE